MGRMIVSKSDVAARIGGTIAAAGAGTGAADTYLDRVAKYIPGEVVALYLGLTALASGKPGGPTSSLFWICFGVGVVVTPLYLLRKFQKEKVTLGLRLKITQIIISTVAFILWAWVLQDPKTAVVDPFWGRFCLPIFTFLVGVYEP